MEDTSRGATSQEVTGEGAGNQGREGRRPRREAFNKITGLSPKTETSVSGATFFPKIAQACP